ncbi:MAG TPA: hypothetical protein P5320_09120, partial [Bacteroidales bacterium]|nr:hypothetical protein [Bacteroidales bacterium]HRR16874.1 hypothetical protein [Bacteroidales bacterium]
YSFLICIGVFSEFRAAVYYCNDLHRLKNLIKPNLFFKLCPAILGINTCTTKVEYKRLYIDHVIRIEFQKG